MGKSLIRRRAVLAKIGMTNSPLYARIKAGTFPKPVKLGNSNAVAWVESEVDEWIDTQIARREGRAA
jgi:prophage regulatory protein